MSHFSGTDRTIEHVERYVCPSVTSDQIVGGKPFRFKRDTRPHVVFVIAEDEYKTEKTLPPFARAYLGRDYRISFVCESRRHERLARHERARRRRLAFVSVCRRVIPTSQLAALRRLVASGKSVVGIRTASHAFSPRGKDPLPADHDMWTAFDADVLGGHYAGHLGVGPKVAIKPAEGLHGHAILTGVDLEGLLGNGSLYKVRPLASSATPLLIGTIPDHPSEPVLWTNLTRSGGRVVYTSLGHPDDFGEPAFQRLLKNAVDWAAGRHVSAEVKTASADTIAFPK